MIGLEVCPQINTAIFTLSVLLIVDALDVLCRIRPIGQRFSNSISGSGLATAGASDFPIGANPRFYALLYFCGIDRVVMLLDIGMIPMPLPAKFQKVRSIFRIISIAIPMRFPLFAIDFIAVFLPVLPHLFQVTRPIPLIFLALALPNTVGFFGALPASIFSHLRRIISCIDTSFALASQAIFGSIILSKVLICRGFPLATFATLFGWDRIWGIMEGHQKFTFLVSNPGALARRCPVLLLATTRVIIAQTRELT